LEFFLLKQFHEYFRNTNLIPYNQFRINILGSKIDIIAISREVILVIELKKDTIKEKDIEQLKTYISWTKNNRTLLGKFFGVELDEAKIQGVIISGDFPKKLLKYKDDCGFSFKKYSLKNGKLELSDI